MSLVESTLVNVLARRNFKDRNVNLAGDGVEQRAPAQPMGGHRSVCIQVLNPPTFS